MWQRFLRIMKHRWQEDASAKRVISQAAMTRLTRLVDDSESRHSGEIRIFIEAALPNRYLWQDRPLPDLVRARALSMFSKLRVWDTEHNNGVLLYLLLIEKRLEIVADRGVHHKVAAEAWQDVADAMRTAFQSGQFEAGLTQAIAQVNAILCTHYALLPTQANPNELSNEPMLG